MRAIAQTPEPPYYAVIFTSVRSDTGDAYEETAARMVELAREQPGFLGVESARDDCLGVTVSYWESLGAIADWKAHAKHRAAQEKGRAEWYREYRVRIARVERSYEFHLDD